MNDSLIARGARAEQILADPLVIEAIEGMERGAVNRLAQCDLTDDARMRALVGSLQAVRSFKGTFRAWVSHGEAEANKQSRGGNTAGLLNRFRRAA